MSKHHDEKKNKKKAFQLKKTREALEIFNIFRMRRTEAGRIGKVEAARKPKPVEKSDEEQALWSEKLATIKDRNNDRKRVSRERWNRFAGTGGEGGRGL